MFRFFTKTIAFLLLIVFIGGCFQYTKPITIERVAVTGASVTAGYGLITPPIKGNFGGYPINLKHIVDAMILAPHEEVAYFGHPMFFARPVVYGSELIEKVTAHEPTLIVAVDYLFWFAYGNVGFSGEEYRIKKFKDGLSILENIQTHLIIGNIPDVRKAIGKVLSASQVPAVETIQKMNNMLRSWAMLHPKVKVLNVYELYKALLDDTTLTTSSYTWPAGSQEKLLQKDMLHTTFEGTVAASLVVADAIGLEGLETNPKILMLRAATIARQEAKK